MPVTVSISFTLPDNTARDLTSVASKQHAAATVIVGATDAQNTQIVFRDMGGIRVNSRILCADTGEMMLVTALPTTAGGACTVSRGTTDATLTIPNYPSSVATTHADQAQVFILQFGGLVEMGRAGALYVIQDYLQQMLSMGLTSETLGSAVQSQAQADAAFQAALNSVMS
jgi:hypothetical protein